ncbi:MAG: hypothetical protein ABSC06_36105 [Rhodopila sp.]
MARAPSASAAPPAGAAQALGGASAGAGGMMGADPSAGVGAGTAGGDDTGDDTDSGGDVVCTITKNGDGSYMVFAGDEPDSGDGGDMSDDDADASAPPGGGAGGGGAGGGMAAPQGTPADSIGAALKAALDILNADKSSEGAPGNADDQLAAGFSANQSPTPASGPKQKY